MKISVLRVFTSGSSAGNGRPEDALLSGQVDLDGRVAAGVVDLTGEDLLDRHLGVGSVEQRKKQNLPRRSFGGEWLSLRSCFPSSTSEADDDSVAFSQAGRATGGQPPPHLLSAPLT